MSSHELRCCCQRDTCDILAQNKHILDQSERDVYEAGKAGQALLERHERYVAESTQERNRLISAMELLERDKEALEASNARIIEENRTLLDQLEDMNNAVTDSDTHISSLKTTLDSTRHELNRLNSLAHKAAQLEIELTTLEAERAKVDTELATNQQDQRSAIQRWRKAEATIGQLQDQIDAMEKEARDERGRHEEVLARMERQRTVNVHLEDKARATGAARFSEPVAPGAGVVSHFVKDILQDNSHLQIGILELKELLMASNSEVSNLRAQIEMQHPVQEEDAENRSLQAELSSSGNADSTLETVPELHFHQHYHQQRNVTARKPRKRRPALPTGHLLRFPSATVQEGHERKGSRGYASVAATILSNTSVTVPAGHRARWSMQSESSYAPSSLSTSPRQAGSVFDSFDAAFDSTPGSSAPGSPYLHHTREYLRECEEDFDLSSPSAHSAFAPSHLRQPSYVGDITIPEEHESVESSPDQPRRADSEPPMDLNPPKTPEVNQKLDSPTRPSHADANPDSSEATTTALPSQPDATLDSSHTITPKPSRQQLRRVRSHDSLLSISGMDIHAPSHSFSSSFNHRDPLSVVSTAPITTLYSNPTVTSTTAVSSLSGAHLQSSHAVARSLLQHHAQNPSQSDGPSLSRRMGGWVFGKWGAAPAASHSVDNLRARAANAPAPVTPGKDAAFLMPPAFRSPGINQSGPILGIPKPKRTPSSVQPASVDTNLLKESLT